MKVTVFGAMFMRGRSDKTGNDYEMNRVFVAGQITTKKTDKFDRRGYGYEATVVEADPAAEKFFAGLTFPCVLDLETDMRPIGGKLLPVVVGIKARAAA